MSLRARVYVFLVSVALIAGGASYFFQHYQVEDWAVMAKAEKPDKDEKEDESTPVEVLRARMGEISARIESTANLRARRDVKLMAQATGVVRSLHAEEGDYVKQGQLLCLLDDRDLKISQELAEQKLAQTKVQLESAKILREKNETQIENKKADIGRNQGALEAGLVSETDVMLLRNQLSELVHDERAQAASVRENEFRVEELAAEIERAKLQISHTRVTAPFNGRITERTVELGQTIGATDELFRLAAFSPLYADAFLSEQDANRVRHGQEVAVTIGAGGETVAGRVIRVSPVVDGSTGTVKVTSELQPRNNAFRPGAFVRVEIETDTRTETVLIPKKAVLEEEGAMYVFVSKGEEAERRQVEVGYEDGAVVEVRSGVAVGEAVIVAGQGALSNGAKIRIVGS